MNELFQNLTKYIELRLAHAILKAKVGAIQMLSTLATYLPILFTALMFIFLMSLALAWLIGGWLNSPALGFLVVGGVYLLITLLMFLFRKAILKKWQTNIETHLEATHKPETTPIEPSKPEPTARLPIA